MKRVISFSMMVLMMAIMCTGCKKDKGKPPVLPPYESMAMDFSAFASGKKSGEIPFAAKDVPDPDENFTFSATVVGFWSGYLALNLVVPVRAFQLAVNNTPVWVADKTWEWKYSITGVTGTYKARLVGKILSDKVEWEMYITREGTGAFAEFMWFEGTSALNGLSGQWILNYSNQFPEPLLQIDWTKSGTTVNSVKYTYIREQKDDRSPDPFKNSTIQYGTTSASLNAFFTIHIYEPLVIQDFVDVFIEWNTTAGNGRVKALYKFGDNAWHCWDIDKNNVTCPV
ncbi:MAG: hypothetical protein RBS37_01915 [Bacteroidales bacterium]|jgi:hypothetical protein|nr:hypothetical protein [Bacteroidales bacterium]